MSLRKLLSMECQPAPVPELRLVNPVTTSFRDFLRMTMQIFCTAFTRRELWKISSHARMFIPVPGLGVEWIIEIAAECIWIMCKHKKESSYENCVSQYVNESQIVL